MSTFEEFAKTYAADFKGVTFEGEQPLVCMEIYKEFQQLYEGKLEEFLAAEGIEAFDFAAVRCCSTLRVATTGPLVQRHTNSVSRTVLTGVGAMGQACKGALQAGEGSADNGFVGASTRHPDFLLRVRHAQTTSDIRLTSV